MNIQLIDEFVLDWKLSGKAAASVDAYAKDLTEFFTQTPKPCLTSTKSWLNQTPLVSRRRKNRLSAVVHHESDRVKIPYRLHIAGCTMQEPNNLTGLFEDRLTDSIKEYVFGLLPSEERNTGIAVDVFTLIRRPYYGVGRIRFEIDVNSYCIATLTDKALRLHHLDNWWELSPAGYRYYERARKEGRHRILRHYDTVIDRYGKLYCHLPNQIGMVEIPRQEITKVSVTTCVANGHVQFHIRDNLMLEIDEFVSVEVQKSERVQRFSSIFNGIGTLVEQVN